MCCWRIMSATCARQTIAPGRSVAPFSRAAVSQGWIYPLRGRAILARPDLDLRGQRAMHRALVGNLHEAGALGVVERAFERDRAVDPVDHAFLGLAVRAIGRVNLGVGETHGDLVERIDRTI